MDEREKVKLMLQQELYFLFSQGLLSESCSNFYSDRKKVCEDRRAKSNKSV